VVEGEGAQYIHRFKGMVEEGLQQQGTVVLKRQPLIWTPSASARG
jgi:hypothetical protein